MTESHIVWTRLDTPGHEAAWLRRIDNGWLLTGTTVFVHQAEPCALDYRVACDIDWRTRSARVHGRLGTREIDIGIDAAGGGWRMNGQEQPQIQGCIDVDLNFSPSTNLLPIRRLGLAVGEQAPTRAAWLRFPEFVLEPLDQLYSRTDPTRYHYQSAGGSFTADLEVDAAGFVTFYPGGWRAELPS